MIKMVGSSSFPIWLLGDSNPENWQDVLNTPLDPCHPARHSIWTPILDVIQEQVYRIARLRVDTINIYNHNAIENPELKPKSSAMRWGETVEAQVDDFRACISQAKPIFILCFGAFSYEFGRRSIANIPKFRYDHWGAKSMGDDFICDCEPLLHFNNLIIAFLFPYLRLAFQQFLIGNAPI